MIYILKNKRNHKTYGMNAYSVDKKSELTSTILFQSAPGTIAYVKEEDKTYIKQTDGKWVVRQKPSSEDGGNVDLTGYATEVWVNNQQFLKPNSLNSYATKEWVAQQIIQPTPYIELNQITQYLYEAYFNELDEAYARDYFTNTPEAPSACSAIRKDNFYGRNFDWLYDNSVEFITHLPRIGSKNAVLGVSGSIVGLTDTFVASGTHSDLYKVIPFRMVDGINEYGMVMNTNVVPNQKSEATFATPTVSEKYILPASMMVYFVLSNFKTVDEAVNYLRDYTKILIPQTMLDQDFFLHWMLADKNRTVLLEIIDGTLIITEMTPNSNSRLAGKSYLTNFYLSDIIFNEDGTVTVPADGNPVEINGITSHGAGLERYNIIANSIDIINSKDDMKELLSSIRYTNAYQNNMGGNWYSEFVGLMDLDLESPIEDFEAVFPYAIEAFENRTRGDGTWQTTHSCVYDMNAGKLYVVSQEQFDVEYEFAIELKKSDLTFKTINNNTILGEGDISIKTYQPMPDDWLACSTMEDFINCIWDTVGDTVGVAYVGTVDFEPLPNGVYSAEMVVEIISDHIALFRINSADTPPYNWYYNTFTEDFLWKTESSLTYGYYNSDDGLIYQDEDFINQVPIEPYKLAVDLNSKIIYMVNPNLYNWIWEPITVGSNNSGNSNMIAIGEAIRLVCSEENSWAEEVNPEDVFYSCEISATNIPNDFWVHPSRYNFIVTIESTDSILWGYTANHFCYMIDNYEGNWGITAVCEDNINILNVKHSTNINKDTNEDVIHILYQGYIEDSPSLPTEGNICSVYLQKLSN